MADLKTASSSQAKLQAMAIMLCARADELFETLGVDMIRSGKLYYGPCPVHGGDKITACNFYHSGDLVPGFWRCYTHHCEEFFKKTVVGFIRGILSNQTHGWTSQRSKEARDKQPTVSMQDTIAWICKFLGQDYNTIKVDEGELEKRKFAGEVAHLTRRPGPAKPGLGREAIRKFLKIPSEYFVSRGWDAAVLDRYDVGLYPAPGKPLSNRVVVPVYDESHKHAVGFTARSIFDRCGKCGRYHDGAALCPDKTDKDQMARSAKWYNHQFNKDSSLFNWWFARKHIESCGVACLVEGPGDLFRLEEAGIKCGLAMYGVNLSEQQQVLLEMSGAMTLIVLTNMDEAGRAAADSLKSRLGRLFKLIFPKLDAKDLGETSAATVAALLFPLIDKHKRSF